MKPTLRASKVSALLSGLVLGLGMPAITAIGKALSLSAGAQNIAFIFGTIFLFFGPVILFVAGTEHLTIKSRDMLKHEYWSSLRHVAVRSIFWFVGGGLGFALLSAANSLIA